MKYAFIVIVILVIGVWIFSGDRVYVLADLSGVLFITFSLLCMMIIAAILAIEMAKKNKYDIVEEELSRLKSEMLQLENSNTFYIEFTQEAIDIHDSLAIVQKKIKKVEGFSYE